MRSGGEVMDLLCSQGGSEGQLGPTLVLPALSIGNVGQLAADLLINSMQLPRIGFLDDPNVLPCVGNDPFGPDEHGDLTLALEVFGAPEGLKIMQQRSPIVKGRMFYFAENLAALAKARGVKEIIILSGVDLGRYDPRQVVTSQVQYISTANPDGSDARCERLGWQKLKEYSSSAGEWQLLSIPSGPVPDVSEDFAADPTHLAKTPFAALFAAFKAHEMAAVCVLRPCSEGDNIPDAVAVAEAISSLTNLSSHNQGAGERQIHWRMPISWTTVYGPPADTSIYC